MKTVVLNLLYIGIARLKFVSQCEKKSCKWGDYEASQDWGYYSKTNGNCQECQDRCNKDKTCGAVECGKEYCSWWKTGTCTRSVASSGRIFTCWKGKY